MGTRHEIFNRVVVIKPWRKHGNGAKGGGRQGSTGKKGQIFQVASDGTRTPVVLSTVDGEDVFVLTGSTGKDVSRKIRNTGLIPQHVAINEHGETSY